MEITEKVCGKCQNLKRIIEFRKKDDSKDGFYSMCKNCESASKKEYYQKKKNGIKAKNEKDLFEDFKEKWALEIISIASQFDGEKSFSKMEEHMKKYRNMCDIYDKLDLLVITNKTISDLEIQGKIQDVILLEMKKIISPTDIKVELKDGIRNISLPFNLSKDLKKKLQNDLNKRNE